MTTLLLCNGERPSGPLARRCVRMADQIIAADGGANAARALGLVPDLIIGDLDSVTAATRRAFAGVRTLHIRRQDNTDIEKALDYIRAHGRDRVIVLGGAAVLIVVGVVLDSMRQIEAQMITQDYDRY